MIYGFYVHFASLFAHLSLSSSVLLILNQIIFFQRVMIRIFMNFTTLYYKYLNISKAMSQNTFIKRPHLSRHLILKVYYNSYKLFACKYDHIHTDSFICFQSTRINKTSAMTFYDTHSRPNAFCTRTIIIFLCTLIENRNFENRNFQQRDITRAIPV